LNGFKSAQKEMANDIKTFGEIGNEIAYSIRNAFADAFTDMILEAKNFKDAAIGFLKMVLSSMVQIVAMQAATKMMMGMGFGFGGAQTTPTGDVNPAMAYYAHRGGIVGEGMMQKQIPAATFIGAPRLHSGLASDEFPTILQRGETVVPRGGQTPPSVEINIDNRSREEVKAQQEDVKVEGGKFIIDIVVDDYYRNGKIRDMIKGV